MLKQAGKHFTAKDATQYIGGYVIFNDITARDIQRDEMKSGVFSFCKGIDSFCPLGPHIVTTDEIADPHNLAMELRVNGEPRQRSHTSKMSVTIPEILAHYSAMGYSAGDVLSTGTVSGVAAFSADPKGMVSEAGRCHGVRDRADRCAAESRYFMGAGLWCEGARKRSEAAGSGTSERFCRQSLDQRVEHKARCAPRFRSLTYRFAFTTLRYATASRRSASFSVRSKNSKSPRNWTNSAWVASKQGFPRCRRKTGKPSR